MTPPDLSVLYRDFITCLNEQSWLILDQFVAEEVIYNGKTLTLSGYRQMLEQLHRELPNLHLEIEMLVASPPLISARLKFDGSLQVSVPGMPTTGLKIAISENAYYKFRAEKICEIWSTVEAEQEPAEQATNHSQHLLPVISSSGRYHFGITDPKHMSSHFFHGAHLIDYSTAIRADTTLQNCSLTPRHWYIDAHFSCADCGADILWSAGEQKVWFETYRFWIDSKPKHCHTCRAKRRDLLSLRQEYDRLVGPARSGGTLDQKTRIVEIIDALEGQLGSIPAKAKETRELFQRQLGKNHPPYP